MKLSLCSAFSSFLSLMWEVAKGGEFVGCLRKCHQRNESTSNWASHCQCIQYITEIPKRTTEHEGCVVISQRVTNSAKRHVRSPRKCLQYRKCLRTARDWLLRKASTGHRKTTSFSTKPHFSMFVTLLLQKTLFRIRERKPRSWLEKMLLTKTSWKLMDWPWL